MIEITKEHPAFKGISWAASARSKDGQRGLDNIKVEIHGEKFKFIGCDGHRLHIFKTVKVVDITEGLYSVEKITKTKIILNDDVAQGIYPQYKSVIPSPNTVVKSAVFRNSLKNVNPNFMFLVKQIEDDFCLDYELFRQLVAIDEPEFKLMIAQKELLRPQTVENKGVPHILIKKSEYFGILMPINSNNYLEWEKNDK